MFCLPGICQIAVRAPGLGWDLWNLPCRVKHRCRGASRYAPRSRACSIERDRSIQGSSQGSSLWRGTYKKKKARPTHQILIIYTFLAGTRPRRASTTSVWTPSPSLHLEDPKTHGRARRCRRHASSPHTHVRDNCDMGRVPFQTINLPLAPPAEVRSARRRRRHQAKFQLRLPLLPP